MRLFGYFLFQTRLGRSGGGLAKGRTNFCATRKPSKFVLPLSKIENTLGRNARLGVFLKVAHFALF